MAVFKNVVLAAALLTPFALAAPIVEERAINTLTETEIVWVTVEETTTVWVNPTDPTPAPATGLTTSISSITSITSSVAPAVFVAPTYTPSAVSTSSTPSAPSIPSTLATTAAAPSEVPLSASSSTSAPTSSSSAIRLIAPMLIQPKDVTASATNTCEGESVACVGDVTHWDGGLGACGWNVDTATDMEIALPFAFMGTQSNGNPYCGRSLTLLNPTSGTTVNATVGDKCMGCVDRAIDCTDALFNAITDGVGDGRVSGIEWWFN